MKLFGKLLLFVLFCINIVCLFLLVLTAYSSHFDPRAYPYLSSINLSFPLFLIINIVFLILWLLAWRFKYALVVVMGLLICRVQILTYCPLHMQTKTLPEHCIKILSYNVMSFDHDKKEKGENAIVNYLRDSQADIICLQEYAVGTGSKQLTQTDVNQALKAYPYHRISFIGKNKGGTMACFSKYPIVSEELIRYESEFNGSVLYRLLIGKDTVTVINNHLESNKLTEEDKIMFENLLEKNARLKRKKISARQLIGKLGNAASIRAAQADSVAKCIDRLKGKTVIVCGDFNDSSLSYVHRVIAKNLQDAFTVSGRGTGISYHLNRFYFRIDNVLVSKNLKCYNCIVDSSIKDSDHYPISCYIHKSE